MNNPTKITLIGAAGRMGKAITQVLSTTPNAKLVGAVERNDSVLIGMDSGLNSQVHENNIPYTSNMKEAIHKADVVIDFSSHSSTEEVLNYCLEFGKPIVIGVTGHSETEVQTIQNSSKQIPILFSPNMSIGVNLLFKLVEISAKVLQDSFDIEILDIHHRHKKDAPSGTANQIKKILLNTLSRNESNVIYGRHGNNYSERDPKQIAIHTMRAGEVVGEHTVYFISPEEKIEIKHSAQDRKTFAVGAVKAAIFLNGKAPGLYSMFDVLGI